MNSSAIIRQYLNKRRGTEDDLGRFPFVTISRQAGCLSKEVAGEIVRQIGGKLDAEHAQGWEVFDQELCNFLADDTKLTASLKTMLTEDYHSEIQEFVFDMIRGTSRQYVAYKRIFAVMRALALLGKVVLIGRGGVHVTKDMPLGIHVRIVGSEDGRVNRLAACSKVSPDEARKRLREMDKSRARMVREFFDKDINDPLTYDAVFNIDKLSNPQIAAQIVDLVEARIRQFNT